MNVGSVSNMLTNEENKTEPPTLPFASPEESIQSPQSDTSKELYDKLSENPVHLTSILSSSNQSKPSKEVDDDKHSEKPVSVTSIHSSESEEHSSDEEVHRKRSELPIKVFEKGLSVISQKYDLDGDGVLDKHEQTLRQMHEGPGLDPSQVYQKLVKLSDYQQKFYSSRRLCILILTLVLSNFVMSFLAIWSMKDTKVDMSDGATLRSTRGGGAQIATRTTGSSATYSANGPSLGGSTTSEAVRRLHWEDQMTLDNQERDESLVSLATSFPLFFSETSIGMVPKVQLDTLINDAQQATLPLALSNGIGETSYMNAIERVSITEVGCHKIRIVKSGTAGTPDWYFLCRCEGGDPEGCTEYEWYVTSPSGEDENNYMPFPCFLQSTTIPIQKSLGETCPTTCNEECAVDLICSNDKICTDNPQGRPLSELSAELFHKSDQARRLCMATQQADSGLNYTEHREEQRDNPHPDEPPTEAGFGDILYYEISHNALDEVAVEKIGNTCWAVWRGSEIFLGDGGQNANLLTKLIPYNSLPDGTNVDPGHCKVRRGFYNGHYDTDGRDVIFQNVKGHLEDCMRDCTDCETILTGHSQGGALAQVAAIELRHLNPTIITFSSPPAFKTYSGKLCPAVDHDRVFRFIITDVYEKNDDGTGGRMVYDSIPFQTAKATQIGHQFVLGDNPHSVPYYYQNEAPKAYFWDYPRGGPINKDTHGINHNYNRKYVNILRDLQLPISLKGWKDGEPCLKNSECESGRCENYRQPQVWYSRTKKCMPRMDLGASCNEDKDCVLGQCIGTAGFLRTCMCLTGDVGCHCHRGSDCKTGRCDGSPGQCMALVETGGGCNENSDCVTGRCDGQLSRTCQELLDYDEPCNEDSDCKDARVCKKKAWNHAKRRCIDS